MPESHSPTGASSRAAAGEVDVAIIGGGLVGASLALGLAGTGVRVLLVESVAPDSAAQPSFDERTTALGNASRRIFQGLGIWEELSCEAAAIRAIHVSDAGRFGFARLKAEDHGIDAFGYVIPNRVIGTALWRRLGNASGVEVRVPAGIEDLDITTERAYFRVVTAAGVREVTSARLVIGADGAHSAVRAAAGIETGIEDYDQVAITATVTGDRAHDGTAYERFTPSGPVAVLPLRGGGYGTIWSCVPRRSAELLALADDAYLGELQSRFGWRAGKFRRIGRRASYPLKLHRAASTAARRVVLIGNAAQALHPVAGQGFNLGLRDAALLAEVIAGGAGDVGSAERLRKFSDWRAADRRGVVRFTDGLVRLFGSRMPGVSLMRDLGLLAFDLAPPAKRALARVSLGFGGPTPRLARGLPLE
ncbi:MAG: 2-octaprenyl-6-methoxyphenyl hydroxylase [Steroidobacteraceae bacterium]